MVIARVADAIFLLSQVIIILRPPQDVATFDKVCDKSSWILTGADIVNSTVPVPCPRQCLSALKAQESRDRAEP